MGDKEVNKKELLQLLQMPGNGECADCGKPGPEWASYTLGIFICLSCSGIHRNLPAISRVKSLELDFWDKEQVQFMHGHGNQYVSLRFEVRVPPFYYRPTSGDCQVLREQWIRAKYERNEFILQANQEAYSTGYREGNLWKRGRDNGHFQKRKFVLSEKEGTLKYFIKSDVIVDWFNAIRAVRYHYLKVAFPGASDKDITPRLTRNYVKEGYMEKTGPKQKESFRKRWFTLDSGDRRLMYFKDPLDAFAKGEIFLGNVDHGYSIQEGFPAGTASQHFAYGITIITPERKYVLACETDNEQAAWITEFRKVIVRPMSPQEYSVEANFRRRH
uniref:Uncharacterized protein n=1 Tax=Eptatretus burgeri TaxID=7764 RepID=A0A8C4NHJ9_EPTBU